MPAHAHADRRPPQAPPDAIARAIALYEEAGRLRAQGKLDDAIAAYDAALRLRPGFPEALRAGAGILLESGRTEAALRFLDEAIRLRPTYLDAVLDRGNALHQLSRCEEALATFEAGLARLPGTLALLVNTGAVLHDLGRLAEARDVLAKAVAAAPELPQAHLNYGNVLARLFDHADALIAFERAIELQPRYPAAHTSKGLALKMLGRFAEAAAAFETALAEEPCNAFALTNRGELRLLLGDYPGGLADYESRLQTYRKELPVLTTPAPPWSGQALAGQRVLTVADDGSGDVIHFARYVPLLVAAGADVTVVCRPRLQRVLKAALRGARVVADVRADEVFDVLIPFSSMPFVFASSGATLPSDSPYLAAEPARVAKWAARLGTAGFKIGVCWRGSQDWRADPNRSLPLRSFERIAAIPGVRLISLQAEAPGDAEADLALERLEDFDAGADGFVDSAALMASLDLVITCDTSIAHLAGALARPTFLMLRTVPEWRWMLEREDTPWYPTMRLFRQRRADDWDETIERAAAVVRDLAAPSGKRRAT